MAVDGSAFFVQGKFRCDLSGADDRQTSTFINTTPDVFVGLFDDTMTTTVTGATISDQFYGADVNFRMRTPLFASLPIFDVMFGLRYGLSARGSRPRQLFVLPDFPTGARPAAAGQFQRFLVGLRLVHDSQ